MSIINIGSKIKCCMILLAIFFATSCSEHKGYYEFKLTRRMPNNIQFINRDLSPVEKNILKEHLIKNNEEYKDSLGKIWIKIPTYYQEGAEVFMYSYMSLFDTIPL